jgi:hypothetical protein
MQNGKLPIKFAFKAQVLVVCGLQPFLLFEVVDVQVKRNSGVEN